MRVTEAQRDALIAHAREEAPNECCGYVYGQDGVVEEVVRAHNSRQSPYGYSIDPKSLYTAYQHDEQGDEVGIYHSHPRSPAEPSQTDINLAEYPSWIQLIVSLEGEPEVRAWRIADGRVEEEPLTIT